MDYLEATTQRSVSIPLNGQKLEVRRANLGLHYRLSIVLERWREARRNKDYKETVELTFGYIAHATALDIETVQQASLSEVMLSFTLLMSLNEPIDDLPFMRMRERGKRREYQYDYEHRGLADWVATLARHYGWTEKYILEELTPEGAVCYMQEAMIHEHQEREFLYRLSEVAYKIEGKDKNARVKYVPYPKPEWMGEKLPTIRVPKAWYPQGNVIEAGDIGRKVGHA